VDLVRSGARFAVPWPCAHEFIAVVTNARVIARPTSVDEAVAFLNDFAALPRCQFLGETTRHLGILTDLARPPGVSGARVHDARIAAICLSHGVSELWTADRDFSYFPRLRTRNPVVA
jgi:predicted nucleic acid-binding protein